jgi:DNA mismatch repair protein MutL
MQSIHELSQEVIAKIAAGEVIERPVFALKELLDNAIDAYATTIKIDIEEGGLKKIHVIDNGIGMGKEDIRESFKPHTTSKIHTAHDLSSITSMGFRGEALWSIASISTVQIKSKEKDARNGNLIELHNGELQKMIPIGMPDGTEVLVEHLYENVPARKKFLKSCAREFQEILELTVKYALAYPEVAFLLKHNGKKYIDVVKDQDVAQRAGILFGGQLYENLLPLHHEHEYIKVHGFITKPQAAVTSTDKQFIFINKRVISDKMISTTVKSSYGTLLEPRSYPIFILFLEMPHERVDVNVHPRKEQVAFAQPTILKEAIDKAVIQTLAEQNLMYHDLRWKKGDYINNTPVVMHLREGGTRTYAGNILKQATNSWSMYTDTIPSEQTEVTQLHNLYLVLQTRLGILLVDQHAAHERILYEQFLKEFKREKSKKEQQLLKDPLVVQLSITDREIAQSNKKVFEELGFVFAQNTDGLIITHIPKLFKDRNLQKLIEEILLDIRNDEEVKEVDSKTNKMIAYIACRAAIKAGDKLSKEHAKKLIKQLNEVENKYTCPHGRPIQIEISLNELHTLFHRR